MYIATCTHTHTHRCRAIHMHSYTHKLVYTDIGATVQEGHAHNFKNTRENEGAQFNFDELFIKRLEQEVYSYSQMLQL